MKAVTLLGYGALAGAALILAVLLRIGVMANDAAGGKVASAFVLGVPFLACLLIAGAAATARGGFAWIGVGRGGQYALVLLACLGVAVITAMAVGLRGEPPDQLPWVMRPIVSWAMFVIPPLALASLAFALSSAAAATPLAGPLRAATAALGLGVLGALLALAGEAFTTVQQQSLARIADRQAFDARRDSTMLAEVQALDAATHFIRLLDHTSRHEEPGIRQLALEKLHARDDFMVALAAGLAAGAAGEVLTYLASNDPPDPAAAAPIALDAMLASARYVRRTMEEAHWLHDDAFDSLADRVLRTADRLAGHGVDFTPAVREFRAALDTPRAQSIRPSCRRTLDAWLARHGAAAGG